MNCRICAAPGPHQAVYVREMMFGFRECFVYFQCGRCHCLQIAEFPAEMARYYPNHYYTRHGDESQGNIPEWLHTMLGGPLLSLRHATMFTEEDEIKLIKKAFLFYFRGLSLNRHSRILDVGCGRGSFLEALSKIGFTHLLGVDLFLESLPGRDQGVTVHKGTLADIDPNRQWDLIMFHHSLEHMPNQLESLQMARQRLAPDGVCLIRIPIVSSDAWERYGPNWVSLDAPRHFFLHSLESLNCLARQVNMQVQKIIYDSTSFQLWASEQYQHDIALYDDRSFTVSSLHSLFSPADMTRFEIEAQRLNQEERGDQAAFYLRPLKEETR
jgi:2-polyprenyl-3-methyl-5-hydroxy-6-metoxy-1,4-benzoquinol methylase